MTQHAVAPRRKSPTVERTGSAALVAVSVVVALAVLELTCRAWDGTAGLLDWSNLATRQQARSDDQMVQQFLHEPSLGYIPRPNFRSQTANHDGQGFRETPALSGNSLAMPPVLATGDSLVYGDESADTETWPAILQGFIHRRVYNAGVNGYGFDQSVLRTEQQAAALKPAAIVIGFIADDLRRTEFQHLWGKEKPYFTVARGKTLALRNRPVPEEDPSIVWSFWRRALGWSHLVETVMRRLGMADEWTGASIRVVAAGTGEQISCLLMDRLAKLGVPTLVVAQYAPSVWRNRQSQNQQDEVRQTQRVLNCAADAGLFTLDTFDALEKAVSERGVDAIFRQFHASPEGNRLIAGVIAEELARHGVVP